MKRKLMIIGYVAMILSIAFSLQSRAGIRFIALTAVFLGAGFYFAYRPQKEECAPGTACAAPKSRKLQRVSLWVVTILTLALIAFPYLIPYLPIG